MPDPAVADRLGSFLVFLLVLGAPLYAGWLVLMRLVVARSIRAGTMPRERGVMTLRRLSTGVLVMALGAGIFGGVTTATIAVSAIAVVAYVYILIAIPRLPADR